MECITGIRIKPDNRLAGIGAVVPSGFTIGDIGHTGGRRRGQLAGTADKGLGNLPFRLPRYVHDETPTDAPPGFCFANTLDCFSFYQDAEVCSNWLLYSSA